MVIIRGLKGPTYTCYYANDIVQVVTAIRMQGNMTDRTY